MIVVVAAVAILALGCGGGGEDTASASVTKAQFVKEAEALCVERKKKWNSTAGALAREYQEAGKTITPKEANDVLHETLLPFMQEEQKKLEGLEAPSGDEARIARMMETRAKAIEAVEKGGVPVLGDPATFGPFAQEARSYGLSCPT